mgnify:CR=1 FL=1
MRRGERARADFLSQRRVGRRELTWAGSRYAGGAISVTALPVMPTEWRQQLLVQCVTEDEKRMCRSTSSRRCQNSSFHRNA